MKTVKQLAKGEKPVGIFFHVDKKSTVITTVEPGEYKRGDVAEDKAGHMICRAVYDPADGDPAYDVQYEVTKVLGGTPKPKKVEVVTDEDYQEPPEAPAESDD
jgi:hypothetical protein